MATLTIRLPEDQHRRLKQLAARRGVSLNKLFEELSTSQLAQADVETLFRIRAARGDVARGLTVLDQVDRDFAALS